MTPHHEKRYHPRVSVQWPTVFFSPQVMGHGTVIDVSALAWRIRSSLPLVAGMQLGVLVWPKLSAYFEIEEGTVLWARDKEFALEIYQVRARDIPAMVQLQQHTLPRGLQSRDSGHEMIDVRPPVGPRRGSRAWVVSELRMANGKSQVGFLRTVMFIIGDQTATRACWKKGF